MSLKTLRFIIKLLARGSNQAEVGEKGLATSLGSFAGAAMTALGASQFSLPVTTAVVALHRLWQFRGQHAIPQSSFSRLLALVSHVLGIDQRYVLAIPRKVFVFSCVAIVFFFLAKGLIRFLPYILTPRFMCIAPPSSVHLVPSPMLHAMDAAVEAYERAPAVHVLDWTPFLIPPPPPVAGGGVALGPPVAGFLAVIPAALRRPAFIRWWAYWCKTHFSCTPESDGWSQRMVVRYGMCREMERLHVRKADIVATCEQILSCAFLPTPEEAAGRADDWSYAVRAYRAVYVWMAGPRT